MQGEYKSTRKANLSKAMIYPKETGQRGSWYNVHAMVCRVERFGRAIVHNNPVHISCSLSLFFSVPLRVSLVCSNIFQVAVWQY